MYVTPKQIKRTFKSWYKTKNGTWFQGEHYNGLRDGRVIAISADGAISLARYREGKGHGPAVSI